MKSAARQLKEKERKCASLENRVKDLEDQQASGLEQMQEQLQSKQTILQYQLDDSKRRNQELEEKMAQSKVEQSPTVSRSEEVLRLHEQMTQMHEEMTKMES